MDFWRLERVDDEDGSIRYELHCHFGHLIVVNERNYDEVKFAKFDADTILKALNEAYKIYS